MHAKFVVSCLLALLSIGCSAPATQSAPARPPGKSLELDRIGELSAKLRLPGGLFEGWAPDGRSYFATDRLEGGARQRVRVELASGARRPLYEAKALESALIAAGAAAKDASEWSKASGHALSADGAKLLINAKDDLWCWQLGAPKAARLTDTPKSEEVGEAFSPDGQMVAFVREFNLWVVPSAGGAERALTTAGDADHLYGRLDWVYQEEVFGRGNFGAYWWSPDSQRLAFLTLDETGVPNYTIVDEREVHPKIETWRYPKAGDPNPKVELFVVDATGGAARQVDLAQYPPDDRLVVRVGWTPDARSVVFQVQNRVQTWLDLNTVDAATGGAPKRLMRDATKIWIEPVDGLTWLAQGAEFLWPSERDGYKHIYRYRADGTLIGRVTQGRWEVDELLGVDEARAELWFVGDALDVKGAQLYRVALSGGAPLRITKEAGTHSIQLAPDFAHYYDSWSSAVFPGMASLCSANGSTLRVLAEVDRKPADEAGLLPIEFHKVKTRDGFTMEAQLIKPAGFDPSKRYPVLCHTYSGPHAPQVLDRWGGFNALWHQYLAQQGYAIWICDNRSASGKGLESCYGVHRDLGSQELADLEDGLDYLAGLGWVDSARIGLWGWSYGGYMTAFALTHSQRFKCGIAGAPVTDWRLYDSIYTERLMGLPGENQAGYERSSVQKGAARLSGKLLIAYGTIDENVHPQNSMQLAREFQEAGIAFEIMPYPGNRHGIVDPQQRAHLYRTMTAFVRANL